MASKRLLIVAAVVLAAFSAGSPALAADLVVGDAKGWDLNVDYDKWVDGHEFIVNDTLVFKYTKGKHSVVQATAASFAACSGEANSLGVWNSGDDRVALNTTGQWWFFSGVGKDCAQGMKFNVTVLPAVELSPSNAPPSGGSLAALPALAAAAAVAAAVLLF